MVPSESERFIARESQLATAAEPRRRWVGILAAEWSSLRLAPPSLPLPLPPLLLAKSSMRARKRARGGSILVGGGWLFFDALLS